MYKAALDVYYYDGNAKAVCLMFEDWEDREPLHIYTKEIEGVADYEPGAFYKRELPCLLQVLKAADMGLIDVIIIDGYVYLDDKGRKGLGRWLYEALEERYPVIGVAKTAFHHNTHNVAEVKRGTSKKPLYVTAIGIPVEEAAESIRRMAGNFRIPDLLKMLDVETKRL